MSTPSVPDLWATLRQRIQEYKDLASKVEAKDAEFVALDPDRTMQPKLEDLGPELNNEANWHTWESRRFRDEIAKVDTLIEVAKRVLEALVYKIGEERKRREDEVAEGWGTGNVDAS